MKEFEKLFTEIYDEIEEYDNNETFEILLTDLYDKIGDCVEIAYKIGYRQAILNISARFLDYFCEKEDKNHEN